MTRDEPSVTIRASSWASLFDCAYKWEGEHLLGMTMPRGPRALMGTAIHASTGTFDRGRIEHAMLTAADTASIVGDVLDHPPYDVDWTTDATLSRHDAERIGLALHGEYCNVWSPRYTFASVEMETKPLDIDCGGGTIVRLTGTMDRSRVRVQSGAVGISDLKTGGAAVQKGRAVTKGHKAQTGTYEMLYEHTMGLAPSLPAEIIGMKTKGTPEIAVAEINGARDVLVGSTGIRGLVEYAAEMFRTGLFPPNPSSHLCNPKYCARWNACSFHD